MNLKKINPWLLVAGALLVILLIWYVFFRDKPDYTGYDPKETAAGSKMPVSKKLQKVGNDTLLKKGTTAQEVQWLQYLYNKNYVPKKGVAKLKEDGVFGTKTEAAVKKVTGRSSITWTAWKIILSGDGSRDPGSPFLQGATPDLEESALDVINQYSSSVNK